MTDLIEKPKEVGIVTHYYGRPRVAVIKFREDVPKGTHVHFQGITTDFEENIDSMEYDHRPVTVAKQGEEIAVRVLGRVREGDHVYVA